MISDAHICIANPFFEGQAIRFDLDLIAAIFNDVFLVTKIISIPFECVVNFYED